VQVRRIRHAIAAALAGMVSSVLACLYLFGK
jgi:hypothetical protein